MANSSKGVGQTSECSDVTKPKKVKKMVLARNLALSPREFKISGKWYHWNAFGTEGDTLDVTGIDMIEYGRYFEIREVEK